MAPKLLNTRQLETLDSWNFVTHFFSRGHYYAQIIRHIEQAIAMIHVYEIQESDYVTLLETILEDDPMLNAYIDSRQWIGEDTRPLFVSLFAKFVVLEVVGAAKIEEIEERRGGV
jgi:hypothetical protein